MPYSSSSYKNLRRWAESDAQFVRSLSSGGLSNSSNSSNNENRLWWPPPPSPAVVDSFSCRQIYLRSYTFSKKETMPEKTIKCFGRLKKKAMDHLDCFPDGVSDGSGSFSSGKEFKRKTILKKKKKKKKTMMTVMKGRSVFFFLFRRLLCCKASFGFVHGGRGGAAVHAL